MKVYNKKRNSKKRNSKKYVIPVGQRMEYEMEKMMQKYLHKFERLVEMSVQEHLRKSLGHQGSGFNPEKFGESKSQLVHSIKEIIFPDSWR